MSTVARPPVNEVVISVSFDSQPVLEGPRLLVGLREIMAEFPQVTEVQPYETATELPFEEQVLLPTIPQIQLLASPPTAHRYWFTRENDEALLLQIQSNYFALNWRRREGDKLYPGFDVLLERFSHYLARLEAAVLEQGGEPLAVSQIELTYINLLHPDEQWGSPRDVGKVVSLLVPSVDNLDQLNVSYSESVTDDSGAFYGRTHTGVSTGYRPKVQPDQLRPLEIRDMTPIINISFTVRSGRLNETIESVAYRFSLAHDAITDTFKSITTDAARNNWGLS
jgi:uncharacterized protein (TIGR04255 family)